MRYPVTVTKLLQVLPPFKDEWITVKDKQVVKDIVREILNDHDEFKSHYDKIGLFFNGNTTTEIADNIFYFLKKNIRYKEESVNDQTTSIPSGILTRQKGDCKHYAELAGGILDSLKRKGKKINWYYRFASYDPIDETPHHVYVAINDRGREIIIDPTPGSESKVPFWVLDKHIKPNSMLRKNIAGVFDSYNETTNDSNDNEAGGGLNVVFTLVSGFVASFLKNIVIGDQVPQYPIKSKNTLKGIIAETQPQFPDPKSVEDAYKLLDKVDYFISVADEKIQEKRAAGKNTAVDETYKMIYQEIGTTYQNYIDTYSDSGIPPVYTGSDDDYPPSSPGPENNNTNIPPKPTTTTAKTNPLLIAALAGGGLFLVTKMGKPQTARSKKVGGIPTGLLWAAAAAAGAYFLFKGNDGPTTQKKREALLDIAEDDNSPREREVFLQMTDDEINTTYEAVFVTTERPLPDGSLKTKLEAIIIKYDIFT